MIGLSIQRTHDVIVAPNGRTLDRQDGVVPATHLALRRLEQREVHVELQPVVELCFVPGPPVRVGLVLNVLVPAAVVLQS